MEGETKETVRDNFKKPILSGFEYAPCNQRGGSYPTAIKFLEQAKQLDFTGYPLGFHALREIAPDQPLIINHIP